MGISTINDIFFAAIERDLDRVIMHRAGNEGAWLSISSTEFQRHVAATAQALRDWGIRKGDRVAILSENRPEWPTSDIASLLLGAITVPLYTTLTPEQTSALLQDSGCRVIFLSSQTQLGKIISILPQTQLEKIVVMDPLQLPNDSAPQTQLLHMSDILLNADCTLWPEIEAQARAITANDLATIVYTSGTTGAPKGAMLTHGNIASNISCSLAEFKIGPGQLSVSFLPLCHITARHVDFAMLYHGVTLAYCPFIEQLPATLLETRPTVFVAVPRVYEKIYAQAVQKAQGFPKRMIFDWALSVGRGQKPRVLAGQRPRSLSWKIADKLVFSKIRGGMGGQIEIFISGGAPLGRELAEWYADAGIRIHEGYGLTETSPVIAVNTPIHHRIGSVGKILPNIDVRIAEDGEILVRGPSVFQGYWNRPQETANALCDGWFKTGDIGHIDADGYLYVTDRKKDLIKTSGGKFIAPQPIENSLKLNPMVGTAAIVGDKRKFPAVLISPNFVALERWAQMHNIPFASRLDLVANPQIVKLYDEIIEGINQNLARFEKLKRVLLVSDEFTVENGILTPTMKLRRRVIEDRYRPQIDEMYAKAEATAPGVHNQPG
ncbi:MAG TPA: long-chain fatty acid--CoA ligase [Candidatus Sulfotelmatobacter sp.]